ncbi:MAG: hypothetical protein NC548_40535 [Lachnospiraceae bacterium]|nr:hypothetical protein [Lachnospiraceae bacterium]
MLDFINYKLPKFDEFIYVTEKMGVFKRNLYTEVDASDTSKIINKFIQHIYNNPNEDYEDYEMVFDDLVTLSYKPLSDPPENGAMGKDKIVIYKQITNENYLDVKYTLIHEFVHLIHQILSNNEMPYEDLDELGKLRYNLLKISSENIKDYKNSQHLMMMLYIIDTNEVFARNQNAYIEAFKCKYDHPEMSNQQIVTRVLKMLMMTSKYLKTSINELRTNDESFSCVLSFLIGNFNELGKSGFQQFFDKSIFQIPLIKKMREDIKKAIYNEFYVYKMNQKTIDIIQKYKSELISYKDEIIESFIKHLKYWFDEAQKRLGKAIQLGIDDALESSEILTN